MAKRRSSYGDSDSSQQPPLPDRDVCSVRLCSPSSRAGRNLDVSTPAQLSLVFFAKSMMQLIQILAGRQLGPAECELRKIKKRIGISQMFHCPGPGHLVKCWVERKCQSIRCFFFFFLSFFSHVCISRGAGAAANGRASGPSGARSAGIDHRSGAACLSLVHPLSAPRGFLPSIFRAKGEIPLQRRPNRY